MKVQLLLYGGFFLLLTACGANKVPNVSSTSLESRADPRDVDIEDQMLAQCNYFNQNELEGTLKTHSEYNSRTGKYEYIPDVIDLRLSSVPSGLLNSGDYYIQFALWGEEGDQRYESDQPVEIYFSHPQASTSPYQVGYLNSDPLQSISRAELNQLINSNNLDISPRELLEEGKIYLTGVDLNYDILTVAYYDGSDTAQSYASAMIPLFAADPNKYAQTHPDSLHDYHPLASRRNSGLSEEQFWNITEDYCRGLL